jgi:hypothetical protein
MDATKGMDWEAVFTPWNIYFYDPLVLIYSNRFVWKCPTSDLLAHYNENVSANHLDIGVGSGYYLAHCRYPSARPRLALMDVNDICLEFARRRCARLHPEVYHRSVLAPISLDAPRFDSVGMTYLLHCLPGSIAEKAAAFDHVRPLMNPRAVLFGATVVQGDVPVTPWAKRFMDSYNAKGFFSNREDTAAGLAEALGKRFARKEVTVRGCVAKFRAYV